VGGTTDSRLPNNEPLFKSQAFPISALRDGNASFFVRKISHNNMPQWTWSRTSTSLYFDLVMEGGAGDTWNTPLKVEDSENGNSGIVRGRVTTVDQIPFMR
jgi:hypothetical protein